MALGVCECEALEIHLQLGEGIRSTDREVLELPAVGAQELNSLPKRKQLLLGGQEGGVGQVGAELALHMAQQPVAHIV